MTKPHWLGIDIGGANIKVATTSGYAASYAFPLWKQPHQLVEMLRHVVGAAPTGQGIAVTMTGELADCYATKQAGVAHILDSLQLACRQHAVRVYLTDGSFAEPDAAKAHYRLAAASNWHALASLVATFVSGDALLIDIGSTTCDVVPLREGRVVADGCTDTERLLSHELLYLGVERTPVSMVVSTTPYRGRLCPLAREVFATMLDVFLVTGEIPERPARTDTADGREATVALARRRLSRCVCACLDEFTDGDASELAEYVANESARLLGDSIRLVVEANRLQASAIVLAGHGPFLLDRARALGVMTGMEASPVLPLQVVCRVSDEVTRCAPAYAVAKLADDLLVCD